MAFKLTVDFNKLSLVVQTDAAEPTTTFIYAQSSVTHTHAEAVSAYTLMSFSDVFLDPDTKNLYFTAQFDSPNALTISMSAGISTINVAKVLADTPVLEELAAKHLDKGAADTSTLSDNFSRVVSYVRSFTDAYQFVDDQSLNVTKLLADTPTITEDTALSVSLAKSDSTSISESAALLASLVKADTPTLSEAITSIDTSLGKSDSITPTESAALLTSLPKTETLTISESDVKAVGKALAEGTVTSKTFTVTVASGSNSFGSGNKYYIDGTVSPTLALETGITYTFDQSDSSNSGHPFRFSTTSNGTHNSGSEYTTNVTTSGTPGNSGAYTEIQVTGSTPSTLHYYCSIHSGMGGQAGITAGSGAIAAMSITESLARTVVYVRTFADAYTLDDLASASDELATESGLNKSNIVSVSDAPAFSFTMPGLTDSYTVQEAASLGTSIPRADSFSTADSQTLSISLAPTDSLTVTENLSVAGQNVFSDQIVMQEINNLFAADLQQDTTSISDQLASLIALGKSDTVGVSEVLADSFAKSLSDSATMSESISVLFIPGGSSILNTAALNTSVLN